MNVQQFDYLRKFLKEKSGLVLGEDKKYLTDSRLNPVAREFGHDSIGEMVTAMQRPGSGRLGDAVIQAMTINESFFFRDMTPFDNFRNVMLPHILESRKNRGLRIWSAAASTGQEAYSLIIELEEARAKMAGWTVDIVGTDLSGEALSKAKAGRYSQFEVQRGMPTKMLMKYFTQTGNEWEIKPALRSKVGFRQFNLLHDYRALGQFDIVFCRNVLIYFDRETKADILARMAKQMAPDAFLVLGAAETIVGLSDDYKMVQGARGLYQRVSETAGAMKPSRTFTASSSASAASGTGKSTPTTAHLARPGKAGATGSLFTNNRSLGSSRG